MMRLYNCVAASTSLTIYSPLLLGMYFLCSWKSPASIVQRCASFFSSHFPTTSWIFNLAISPSVFFSRLASGKSSKSIWRLRPFVYSLDCCFFQQLNAHCNILPDFVLCTTKARCSVEVFLQFFEYPNERVYLGDLKSVVKKKSKFTELMEATLPLNYK